MKDFREKLEFTQKNFAGKLEISTRMYIKYEKGDTPINLKVLTNLIKKFNINANWLITGEGKTFIGEEDKRSHLTEKDQEKLKIIRRILSEILENCSSS